MITHLPADYQPRTLSVAQQQQAEDYALKKTEEVYNKVNLLVPFVVTFEHEKVNDLFLLAEQKGLLRKVSPGVAGRLSGLQVSFQPGVIKLMARLRHPDVTSVISVIFKLRMLDTGQLELTLSKMQAGALGLPEGVIKAELRRLVAVLRTAAQPQVAEETGVRGSKERKFLPVLLEALLPALEQWPEKRQLTVTPVFKADDDKTARIIAIELIAGRATLVIQPEIISNSI